MPSPTNEQLAILEHMGTSRANLLINALAGTGKSTTIRMIERASRTRPILYLAFNKKVVEDIEYKPKAEGDEADRRCLSTTTVRTFNSIGHRTWAGACARGLTLDAKKSQTIFRELLNEIPKGTARDEAWASYWSVISGVAMAKALGYVPEHKFPTAKRLISTGDFHASLEETPDDLTCDLIDAVLTRSITTAYDGLIDFNDQVYMPALFGGTFPRFPLVAVDEAQDLSPVNHALLRRLVTGRVLAVGDPWQNIYAFRGAEQGSMAKLQTQYAMTPLDLSISFRCPEAIVENARWRVPHFKWIKPGGHVEILTHLDGMDVGDNATFICRNNAPLFRLAFNFLSRGRSVRVAGSDIGPKLIGILRRLGSEDLSRSATLTAIEDWRADREDKGSTSAHDMAECMRLFAEHGDSLGQAIRYAEHLFAQQGSIRLLTGHKAKGLEFPLVYHLDPWLCRPDSDQDLNLAYVIQTRSLETYFEIDSRSIKW